MIHESIKIFLMVFSASLFGKKIQMTYRIHSVLALSQYVVYWIYLLQHNLASFSFLNEILNFGILTLIILCLHSNSHVFIIWFIWNISFMREFEALRDICFLSSLLIGVIASFSLKRPKGKVGGKSPEETANFEQLITFSWFNGLLDYGKRNVLEMGDIFELMEKDTSKMNYERFKDIR